VRAKQATVVDIAALMGVTPARIRQLIAKHGIEPTGTRWKAKLYDPREFLEIRVGHHRPKGQQPAIITQDGSAVP
jgi:hypothetical protein